MTTETIIAEEYGRNSLRKLVVHDTEIMDNKARLASELITRWGMVTGTVNGEDSSGRSKLIDLTPVQVVDRACEIADLAIEAFRTKGWFVQAPPAEELIRTKMDD